MARNVEEEGATPWRDERGDQSSDPNEPPWLVRFQHQYGGYGCLQAELGGLVMPLRGRPDTDEVVASLAVLGCGSPDDRAIRLRPDLMPLHLARAPYDTSQLATLARALEPCASLPAPIGGDEALVELDASEAARRFRGWSVLAPELPRRSHLADSDAADVVMDPNLCTHARLDDRLLAAATAHFPSLPLRLFLVWYNSD